MQQNQNDILSVLPTLTVEQLRGIHAATAHLIGNDADTPSYKRLQDCANGDGEIIYGIIVACAAKSHSTLPPAYAAMKTTRARSIIDGCDAVHRFVVSNWPTLNKKGLITLYNLLATRIVAHLTSNQIPVTLGGVVSTMPKAGALFECALPGYLSAGLGSWIIDRLCPTAPESIQRRPITSRP